MVGYLRRYIDFYQGLKGPPRTDTEGSMRRWFYFRLIHQMRVGWENAQREKEKEGKGEGKSPAAEQSRPSRRRESNQPKVDPGRAEEENREMTQAEKIAEAQERLGVQPHVPAETLRRKPKGFKSTRVKGRRK